jgi:hypothetical protein
MVKTRFQFRALFVSSLIVIILISVVRCSHEQQVQASVDIPAMQGYPAGTMVPTVTGWPSPTPTVTPSPILPGTPSPTPTETSYPGPPVLIFPPDGALLPQPVSPDEWYFSWSADCGACFVGISIHGPDGRVIGDETDWLNEYHYSTDTYLPDDALGPWTWRVWAWKQLGSSVSETRTFWVQSATVKFKPPFHWYLPGVVQYAP